MESPREPNSKIPDYKTLDEGNENKQREDDTFEIKIGHNLLGSSDVQWSQKGYVTKSRGLLVSYLGKLEDRRPDINTRGCIRGEGVRSRSPPPPCGGPGRTRVRLRGPQNTGAAPSRVHSFLTGRLSRAWVGAVSAQKERCNRTQRVEEAPGSPSGHPDLKNLFLLRVTPLERGTANTLLAPSSQSPSYNNSKDKKRHCWKGLHVEVKPSFTAPSTLRLRDHRVPLHLQRIGSFGTMHTNPNRSTEVWLAQKTGIIKWDRCCGPKIIKGSKSLLPEFHLETGFVASYGKFVAAAAPGVALRMSLPDTPAEGDPFPYLPELQLSVEGFSDGDDPAKIARRKTGIKIPLGAVVKIKYTCVDYRASLKLAASSSLQILLCEAPLLGTPSFQLPTFACMATSSNSSIKFPGWHNRRLGAPLLDANGPNQKMEQLEGHIVVTSMKSSQQNLTISYTQFVGHALNGSKQGDVQKQRCAPPTLLYEIPSNTDVISAGVDTVTTIGWEDIKESSSCTGAFDDTFPLWDHPLFYWMAVNDRSFVFYSPSLKYDDLNFSQDREQVSQEVKPSSSSPAVIDEELSSTSSSLYGKQKIIFIYRKINHDDFQMQFSPNRNQGSLEKELVASRLDKKSMITQVILSHQESGSVESHEGAVQPAGKLQGQQVDAVASGGSKLFCSLDHHILLLLVLKALLNCYLPPRRRHKLRQLGQMSCSGGGRVVVLVVEEAWVGDAVVEEVWDGALVVSCPVSPEQSHDLVKPTESPTINPTATTTPQMTATCLPRMQYLLDGSPSAKFIFLPKSEVTHERMLNLTNSHQLALLFNRKESPVPQVPTDHSGMNPETKEWDGDSRREADLKEEFG
ncbi:hypothetical protein U0070_005857 [Myodes glareolus]|uniref:Uncharacterized protein n=1 Tax=Myodes glareolus TaxID=447135 RepID=A0AAW0IJT6_MYOGA